MNICVAGDVHGRLDEFYKNIRDFELRLKISFDVVLQVGDLGVWIDAKNHDGMTKLHNGTGDFPKWYREKKAVPVKTYFINGNNEDFNFLDAVKLSGDLEVLKDLFYIPNGTVHKIKSLIVAGVGGKYDPEHFGSLKANRYYTKHEVNNLINYCDVNRGDPDKQIDIFISHDAPEGVLIEDNDKNRYYPESVGLRKLVLKIMPRLVFFGHHHGICSSNVDKIPVYGLNVLGEKGSFIAVRKEKNKLKILGRYP